MQAWLAATYGERAGELLTRHGGEAVAVLAAVTLIAVLLYPVRRRSGPAADDDYPADTVEAADQSLPERRS